MSKVAICVRSGPEIKVNNKPKKNKIMINNEKKWTVICRMIKCSPSSGHNGQLVHWWMLVHSGPLS